mgnify:CR=1 FL=1
MGLTAYTLKEYWCDPWCVIIFFIVFLTTILQIVLKAMPAGDLITQEGIKQIHAREFPDDFMKFLRIFRLLELFKRVAQLKVNYY